MAVKSGRLPINQALFCKLIANPIDISNREIRRAGRQVFEIVRIGAPHWGHLAPFVVEFLQDNFSKVSVFHLRVPGTSLGGVALRPSKLAAIWADSQQI
jgi:hypothetical protein